MRWEVAEDEEFARGTTVAKAASDHTVKADVRGLSPATTYWFRFSAGDGTGISSPHGPHPYRARGQSRHAHTQGTEGSWADRAAGAKQAYFEWMPVHPVH